MCAPNTVAASIHPKARPVALSPAEAHAWLTAPPAKRRALPKLLAEEEMGLLERERNAWVRWP